MGAKSIKGNSIEEMQPALRQSIAGGFKPTLAIVMVGGNLEMYTCIAAL